ncbi:hypothetical protein EYF80_065165 [Liparis tanakae]|uniref:Uncharacterized protein n=1 Tax=Liparis tanakae TaxID=230148 RepID=A0A4Z2E7F2_9TELE|nr:hypothetical protein EYF80_065165 [Liparis tanakae]
MPEGGWRPQVPFDDDEGEEDHWDSEDDSGYGSMSEREDEEEEDDQPFHPLPSPSLLQLCSYTCCRHYVIK